MWPCSPEGHCTGVPEGPMVVSDDMVPFHLPEGPCPPGEPSSVSPAVPTAMAGWEALLWGPPLCWQSQVPALRTLVSPVAIGSCFAPPTCVMMSPLTMLCDLVDDTASGLWLLLSYLISLFHEGILEITKQYCHPLSLSLFLLHHFLLLSFFPS